MSFQIQPGNPKTQKPADHAVEDLSEAIEEIFRADEDALLWWNGLPVKISYKYDLSVLVDDLLPLLDKLLSSPTGTQHVYWGSNTFRAQWDLQWATQELEIQARWESVAGNYEELLNARPTVKIDQMLFVQEWQALLHKVLLKVSQANLELEDDASLQLLHKIRGARLPGTRTRPAA